MPANQTTTPLSEDAVRTRAYLMWEADGRPFGQAEHYWHLALSEINAGGTAKPRRAAASSGVAEKTSKPKAADRKAAGAKTKRK
jgi:hypothetical protein